MINQIIVPCHVHPVHLATHLLVEGERVIVEESQCPSSSAAVLCKAAMIMTEMRERERERGILLDAAGRDNNTAL